jgi:hypothetical protein
MQYIYNIYVVHTNDIFHVMYVVSISIYSEGLTHRMPEQYAKLSQNVAGMC